VEEKQSGRAAAPSGGGRTMLAASGLVTTGLLTVGLVSAGLLAAQTTGRASSASVGRCAVTGCASGLPAPAGRPATKAVTGSAHPAAKHAAAGARSGRATAPAKKGAGQPARVTASTPAKVWTTSLPAQHLDAPIVAMAITKGSLLMVGADGGAFPVGAAGFYGSLSANQLSAGVAAVAVDPATGGYWMAGRDGGVFAFHAPYHGSVGQHSLGSPVVAMAATRSGRGYWLASSDGGVFAFGDARYAGSLSNKHLGSRVVAMAPTPSGRGYWLVSADGGVFAFGDAGYTGSLSGKHLGSPVVAMATVPSGRGYWLVSADGGVFAFGDARFRGGRGVSSPVAAPVRAFVPTPSGHGYWLAGEDGSVYSFGDARPVRVVYPKGPAVTVASRPEGRARGSHPARVTGTVARYRPGSTGFDISQYQCGNMPGHHNGIAVVQITGGAIDNPPNPCYRQEAAWAGRDMSAYIYMDGLPSPAPSWSLSGPAGNCVASNIACASFNYGSDYARYWVGYSRSQGVDPKMWWLDVERYSGWKDPVSNKLLVIGALNGLHSMHVTAGVYSTASQWQELTGNASIAGTPVWTAGAGNLAGPGYSATSFCAAPGTYSFGNGKLTLVQYGYQGPFPGSFAGPAPAYDQDFAC